MDETIMQLFDDEEDCSEDTDGHNSTEESAADNDNESSDEEITDATTFTGKDKTTVWNKTHKIGSTKVEQKIFNESAKVKGFAQGAKSPIEAWQMFFPDSAIDEIVECTNAFIASIRKDYSRERDASDTNQAELKAVLGLFYLAGIMKSSHQNLSDLWAKDGTGVEYFHATMSLKRFRFLLYSLQFDNADHQEHRSLDKLAPIRTVFDNFTTRCKQHFSIGNCATIDNIVEPFRGKCPFRQYIKSTSAKCGIKMYALVDSKLFYTLNMEVHVGTQPEGPFKLSTNPKHIVERLIQPIANSWRTVTFERRFMTLDLATVLFDKYKLTSVGLLKKNLKELPPQFGRKTKNPLFGFQTNTTIVSCTAEKGKHMVLLSTLPHTAHLGDVNNKLEIATFYSSTKNSVNHVQKLVATHSSVSRKTNRSPLTIFFTLLNIAGLNSQILLQANTNSKLNRREYLVSLSKILTTDYLKLRATAENLPQQLKLRKRQLAGLLEEEASRRREGGPGRCLFCSWKKNRKTTTTCFKCSTFICREHTVTTCVDCHHSE